MWPRWKKSVSGADTNAVIKNTQIKPVEIVAPRMSGRLRSAVVTSFREAAANGEVWSGVALRNRLGGAETADYSVNGIGLFDSWTPDLMGEATQRVLSGDRLILPSDVLAEAIGNAPAATQRGIRVADVTLIGDLDIGYFFACPQPPQGVSIREKIDWLKEKCDDVVAGHEPLREADNVIDKFDVRNLELPGVEFCRCTIKGGVFAAGTTFKGDLVLDQCVLEYLFIRAARIKGNLIVRDARLCGLPPQNEILKCDPPKDDPAFDSLAALTAIDGRFEASVYLVDTVFFKGANFDRAHIEGSLFGYGSHFEHFKTHYDIAALSLDASFIGGSVWLSGDGPHKGSNSKGENDLDRDPTVAGSIGRSRRRLFCAIGGVNLRNAEIRGTLNCSGAILVPFTYLHQSELLSQKKKGQEAIDLANKWDFHDDPFLLDMSLRCAGITVGHDVNLDDRFSAVGILDFTSASIGRQFNFRMSPWDKLLEYWSLDEGSFVPGTYKTRLGREDWGKKPAQALPSWYLDLEDGSIDDTLRINLDQKSPPDTISLLVSEPQSKLRHRRAVVDLRNVKCPVYTDDFDASNKLFGERLLFLDAPHVPIEVSHNWPKELSLQLGGFDYNRIRIDEKSTNREDRRSHVTRDRWLRLQYQNRHLEKDWGWWKNFFKYHILRIALHRTPVVSWAWRILLLVVAAAFWPIRLILKVSLFDRYVVAPLFNKPANGESAVSPKRIKIDWQPRQWRQYQADPWIRCADTLARSGQQADARRLRMQRERYALLQTGADQLEKSVRHLLLSLSGHGYRRRWLAFWGFAAGFIMWLNYQVAFEIGLVKPMEAEVHVSDYHLETNLAPPSQVEANTVFLAIEKITPGLNFFLEENWSACDATQIRKAETYARCVIRSSRSNFVGDNAAIDNCRSGLGNELPPLVCLPRRVHFPTPWYTDSKARFSFDRAPLQLIPMADDCLANGDEYLESCYIEGNVVDHSRTANWYIDQIAWIEKQISWVTFGLIRINVHSPLNELLNAYFLGGGARIGSWLLMLFGWLLVGIGAASLSGILRRDD